MSGLAWRKKRLGEPKGGIKLENEKLAEALIEKHTAQSSDQDEVVFTETEWKALDLTTEIHEEHFVRTGDWCFQPTGTAVTFRKTTCESSAWRLLLPSDLDHRAGGRISMLRSWYATSLLLLPFCLFSLDLAPSGIRRDHEYLQHKWHVVPFSAELESEAPLRLPNVHRGTVCGFESGSQCPETLQYQTLDSAPWALVKSGKLMHLVLPYSIWPTCGSNISFLAPSRFGQLGVGFEMYAAHPTPQFAE